MGSKLLNHYRGAAGSTRKSIAIELNARNLRETLSRQRLVVYDGSGCLIKDTL